MSDVRTGHDYHLAEVRRVPLTTRSTNDGHEAYCDACGWVGPVRGTHSAADDDATAHDIANNPADNRRS